MLDMVLQGVLGVLQPIECEVEETAGGRYELTLVQPITDDGRQEINARFAPLTVDMESGAVAHVCHANGVPFLAIRTVTDTADHSGAGNFELNCKKASAIAKDFTLALLREIQNA